MPNLALRPAPAIPADQTHLNLREGASYLRCSQRHLEEQLRRRRIPFSKIGRRVILRREDLDAFVAANRVAPVA